MHDDGLTILVLETPLGNVAYHALDLVLRNGRRISEKDWQVFVDTRLIGMELKDADGTILGKVTHVFREKLTQ